MWRLVLLITEIDILHIFHFYQMDFYIFGRRYLLRRIRKILACEHALSQASQIQAIIWILHWFKSLKRKSKYLKMFWNTSFLF